MNNRREAEGKVKLYDIQSSISRSVISKFCRAPLAQIVDVMSGVVGLRPLQFIWRHKLNCLDISPDVSR
jgi:hypothetical protein